MTTEHERGSPVASWESILRRAITTPGLIHEAYHRFHQYSLRNQLLAMAQCLDRGLAPGPLATFKQWEALGRHVIRGEKALVLCVPITTRYRSVERNRGVERNGRIAGNAEAHDVTRNLVERHQHSERDDAAEESKERESSGRTFFMYRSRWFVLAQTDGEPYEPVSLPSWSEERVLGSLGVRRIPFEHVDGNAQGYSTSSREIAISPVAALPHKTLFHEVAHILLDHQRDNTVGTSIREVEAEGVALLCCEALDLDGAAYARGYLQHWLQKDELTPAMAQRIIKTAHQILGAGDQRENASGQDCSALAPIVR